LALLKQIKMKKQSKKNSIHTKRKNQTSRIRAVKANKQNTKSFLKKRMLGETVCNNTVQPIKFRRTIS
jgi:hypothetical protein